MITCNSKVLFPQAKLLQGGECNIPLHSSPHFYVCRDCVMRSFDSGKSICLTANLKVYEINQNTACLCDKKNNIFFVNAKHFAIIAQDRTGFVLPELWHCYHFIFSELFSMYLLKQNYLNLTKENGDRFEAYFRNLILVPNSDQIKYIRHIGIGSDKRPNRMKVVSPVGHEISQFSVDVSLRILPRIDRHVQ